LGETEKWVTFSILSVAKNGHFWYNNKLSEKGENIEKAMPQIWKTAARRLEAHG
jgi:hypothetical protein